MGLNNGNGIKGPYQGSLLKSLDIGPFQGLGVKGLGFRGLGFRGLGFRGLGFWAV